MDTGGEFRGKREEVADKGFRSGYTSTPKEKVEKRNERKIRARQEW